LIAELLEFRAPNWRHIESSFSTPTVLAGVVPPT
jgi:hypothetical protein